MIRQKLVDCLSMLKYHYTIRSHLPVSRRVKVQLPNEPLHNTEIQTLLFIGNAGGQIHIM
jgi:hypothetical protein